MITQRLAALLLVFSWLTPEALVAQARTGQARPTVASANTVGPSSVRSPQPATTRPRAARPTYEREPHRRHNISKQEVLFLGAIAGTSMGIGALAGGAKGLAIGSIVGGWGAYLGHRLWKRVR
jgi:hypothetical protein